MTKASKEARGCPSAGSCSLSLPAQVNSHGIDLHTDEARISPGRQHKEDRKTCQLLAFSVFCCCPPQKHCPELWRPLFLPATLLLSAGLLEQPGTAAQDALAPEQAQSKHLQVSKPGLRGCIIFTIVNQFECHTTCNLDP